MLHKKVLENKSGFRTLESSELKTVSGGILVIGDRPDSNWGDLRPGGIYDNTWNENPDILGEGPGVGGSNDNSDGPEEDDCHGEGTTGEGQGEDVDEAAQEAADAINSASGQIPGVLNFFQTGEQHSILYEDENGEIQVFGPMPAIPADVPGTFTVENLTQAFLDAGHTGDSIRGTVHNHPAGVNGDTATSAYPSPWDWTSTAYTSIEGADPSNMSIYIIDNLGNLREFSYADQDFYFGMTEAEQRDLKGLPDGTEPGNGCEDA